MPVVVDPSSVRTPLGLSETVPVSGLVCSVTVALSGTPRRLIVWWIGGMLAVPVNVPAVRSPVALSVEPAGNARAASRPIVSWPPSAQLVIGMVRSPVSGVVRAADGSGASTPQVLGGAPPASRWAAGYR